MVEGEEPVGQGVLLGVGEMGQREDREEKDEDGGEG